MLRVKSPQDLGAALVFVVIGGLGIYFGQDLRFGTAARMGPGFFPFYLSLIIIALGVIVGARAFVLSGPPIAQPQVRPLLMLVIAILVFGYAIEHIGLVAVGFAVVVIAGFARRDVSLKESALLAIGLTLFIVAVFVLALRQPLPLWGI